MLEPRGAQIINFPAPISTPAPSSSPGLERLSKAMTRLDAELAAQRRAVAEWRAAIADLQGAMRGMGESVQAYRGNLDALGIRVAALRSGAERLGGTDPCH